MALINQLTGQGNRAEAEKVRAEMATDANYAAWKAEAQKTAAENADLKQQLAAAESVPLVAQPAPSAVAKAATTTNDTEGGSGWTWFWSIAALSAGVGGFMWYRARA